MGATNPDHQGETGWLLRNEGKEKYVRNTGGHLGCFSVSLWPEIKVSGKLQQPKQAGLLMVNKGSDHPAR